MNLCKWFKNIFKKEKPTVEENIKAVPKNDLSAVTHLKVFTISKNWDADAERDGIEIEISLRDKDDNTIEFEDGILTSKIKINMFSNARYLEIEGKTIYSKTTTISKRIKIPFEEISAAAEKYGVLYVQVTLPDGRSLEAKENYVRIKI